MSNKKAVYLMAGGRGGRNNDLIIQSVFKDTGKKSPTIAYVGVASEDNWGFYLMISQMIKNAGDCQVKRVVIVPKKADINKAKETLESADAIFISGGDVEAGMDVLKEKSMLGFFTDLFEHGKLFFGASAGSIMMAKEWVRWRDPDDDTTAEMFSCMGLAPIICDTHAEADNWEELNAALKLKQEGTCGYGITTGSCLKVLPDGTVEALGGAISQYSHDKGTIKRQPDLLPAGQD